MGSSIPPAAATLPYGRQWIDADDVAAVTAALQSPMIAHGPRVQAFEEAFARSAGAEAAVAVSSGTAALHVALATLDLKPNDVCVAPAVTFLATATAIRLCGAEVAFCDVDPLTGLMTPQALAQARDRHGPVRAVLPVHLGGRLCDLEGLSAVMTGTGAVLIEDAAHAVGGLDQDGAPVGACRRSLAAIFSFHPVKTLTSGEGGMVTLNDQDRARRMRRLRNHGVTHDPALMTEPGSFDADGVLNPWSYEQCELGFNYRMNELEAALGLSQLAKLERFIAKRIALADRYDIRLAELGPLVRPAARGAGRPGLHLFVVMIDFAALGRSRARVMTTLRSQGVGTQVHYIPLYRQPYFKRRYGEMRLPGAEAYYDRALALPLHPSMGETDVDRVVDALKSALFGP